MFLQRQVVVLRRVAATRPCANPVRYNSTSSKGPYSQRPKPKTIFSGIQPTGVPHLGNYLGALRQWVKLQNEAEEGTTLLFSIVDLHAVTAKQQPRKLAVLRKQMLAALLAVGLDPEKSIIFCQSGVPQHAELMWLLSCNASMGYLSRMTQWKSKMSLSPDASPFDAPSSNNSREALKLGLFSYPVLQAADILLYKTTHVPVGEDQAQHIEFTRELATSFNHAYQPVFVAPQTILSPAKRVMSLQQPTKKMSKSDPNEDSRILINDSEKVIERKIKAAKTDSINSPIPYDSEQRPGVSNLIDIAYYMGEGTSTGAGFSTASPEFLAQEFHHFEHLGEMKAEVTRMINKNIWEVRERYEEIMKRDRIEKGEYLNAINERGIEKARAIAEPNLQIFKKAMGLRDFL